MYQLSRRRALQKRRLTTPIEEEESSLHMVVGAGRDGLLGAGVNAHRITTGAGECAGFSEGGSRD